MLGTLLESRAGRSRRTGGATLSVALHLAIVGAVAAGAAPGRPAPRMDKPVVVSVVPPASRRVPPRDLPRERITSSTAAPNLVIRRIDAPRLVPAELPPIDASRGIVADSIVIGGGAAGLSAAIGRGTLFAEDEGGGSEWKGNEVLMHVLTPARPRYPESLRSAGVDGRVLVEFTVDTTGRVDAASVKVLSSTHELFTRAVRDALAAFRFRAAEVNGRKVPALAQMPFEFQVTR